MIAGACLGLTMLFVWRFQSFLVNRIEVAMVVYEVQAITQRLDAARIAVQIFYAHPLTGVGLAQSVVVTRDLLGAPIDWIHNVPLLIAAELGAVGLMLIGLLLIALAAIGGTALAKTIDHVVAGARRWIVDGARHRHAV